MAILKAFSLKKSCVVIDVIALGVIPKNDPWDERYIYLHGWLICMVLLYLGKYTVRPMDGFWNILTPLCLRSWGPSCDVPIHLRGRMCVDMTHWYILIPFFQDVIQHSCLLSACCICFMTFPSPTEDPATTRYRYFSQATQMFTKLQKKTCKIQPENSNQAKS